jgi:hypothetical protein
MHRSLRWAGMAVLAFSSTAIAAAPSGFKVKPWTYDPDGTGIIESRWIANAGNDGHALFLEKDGPTPTNAAAGATVEGVEGITLTELGFDYRDDGYCGAGAPRFNVYTPSGVYYFFGCIYGTHTPAPGEAGWTRVRFGDVDAYPADGVTPFPGFGSTTVDAIEIVFDEGPGSTHLDNVDVNGTLIGKPGNAK